jgi:hypothetical protein
VLIGDHGSATTYAAAVGVPVVRSPGPGGLTAPGSATELLGRLAPELAARRPLPDQFAAAVASSRTPAYASVARAVTSEPGRAARLLRTRMYGLMALPEPAGGATAAPVHVPALIEP